MNALRHQFILSIPTEDLVVHCDALRIEQALNHLVNNAVTYSSTGGTIRIHLETNEVEGCLSVADQGVAIAPEHLVRIFDRFYRLSAGEGQSIGSGSGLGLSF